MAEAQFRAGLCLPSGTALTAADLNRMAKEDDGTEDIVDAELVEERADSQAN